MRPNSCLLWGTKTNSFSPQEPNHYQQLRLCAKPELCPSPRFVLFLAGQPEGLLLIRLAGVELAPGATAWLQRELLPKQPLWFQLLGRDSSALNCLVLVHKVGTQNLPLICSFGWDCSHTVISAHLTTVIVYELSSLVWILNVAFASLIAGAVFQTDSWQECVSLPVPKRHPVILISLMFVIHCSLTNALH